MRAPDAPGAGATAPATAPAAPVGLKPVPPTAWRWLLIGSAAALAVDFALWLAGPSLRSFAAVVALLVVVAALVAVVVGLIRYRPAHPLSWRLIVAGFVVALVGEALAKLMPTAAYPSAKDTCFLLMYALLVAGIGVMARVRIQGAGRAAVLDSLIVTIALGLIAAEFIVFPFLVEPYLRDPTLSGAARWITIGALVGDMLLLAGGVLLAAGGPLHPPSLVLLLTGVALQLVDDTVSAALMSDSAVANVARLLSYSFLGAAALHPSMRVLTEPAPTRAPHLSAARIALLVVAAVLTPLVVLSVASARHPTLTAGLLVVALVLAILVFARIWGLSAAMSAQSSRYQRLLDQNVRAREDERLQIAADLHDGPIQRLTSMGLTAELARRRLAKGNETATARLLEQLTGDLGDEVMSLRRVMVELRPPVLEEWGLSEALHAYVSDFERRTGIKCLIRARTSERFDHSRETILYRVTQEALTNVAKHAHAEHVWISLSATGGTVGLVIRDDGDGFDPATLDVVVDQGHFGLAGIRQRVEVAGGAFQVSSEPGKGTTIVVSLPPPGEAAGGLAGLGRRRPAGPAGSSGLP